VTTFLSTFFPKFNPEAAINNIKKSKKFSNKSPYSTMTEQEILKKWSDESILAKNMGTILHKQIEDYYNNASTLAETKEDDKEETKVDDKATSKELNMFLQYDKEEILNRYSPYRTEWSIWMDRDKNDRCLAGQVDMIYQNNETKKYMLVDWKRSKEIKYQNNYEKGLGVCSHLDNCNYVKYSLQLNCYKHILEKYYDIEVEDMFLVVLHPNNDTYIKIQVNGMDDTIKDIIDTLQAH